MAEPQPPHDDFDPGDSGVAGKVAAGLIVMAAITGVALFAWRLTEQPRPVNLRLELPGSAEVDLNEAGRWTIWREVERTAAGTAPERPAGAPQPEVEVTRAIDNVPLPLRAPLVDNTFDTGERVGYNVYTFDVDAPGRFRIAGRPGAAGPAPVVVVVAKQVLGPGPAGPENALALGLAGVGLALAVIVVSLFIAWNEQGPRPPLLQQQR